MSLTGTTWTYLAVVLLFIGSITSEIRPCPITSVGKSYQMVCSGKTKTSSRFILWDREEHSNNTLRDLSRCYFNNPCTILMDESRYTVTNNADGTTFESVLTIRNVSHGDVGVTIHCKAMDVDSDGLSMPTTISTCQLPVFSLVETSSCHATPIGPNVQLDCSFPKIHPKLFCRFGYDRERFETDVPIEYEEKYLAPDSPLYKSINCKGLLKVLNQTQTKYFVKLLPNFNRELSDEALEVHAMILEVNLLSTPKVVINMPRYIPICPPGTNHTLTLHCSATTVAQFPKIRFYFGDVEVKQQRPSSIYKTGDMHSTLQEYSITVNRTSQDTVLRCSVGELHEDTAVISLATPPTKPPQFLSKEGFVMRPAISLNETDSVSVRCAVSDGIPLVVNISVFCETPNRTRFLKVGNVSNVVYFTIAGPETVHGSVCACTAYHISGCYNAIAWLKISHIGREVAQAPIESVHTHLMYIAAIFVGLIVIPVLVATCVFLYRNWDQLYKKHPPRPNSHYDYIEPERTKKKRRKSSHSESSMSVNSDYMSRYRDHIQLHNLESGERNTENEMPPAPPPCNRHGNNNNVKNELPRTPSESDSQYESRIPVFPTRNKSASSYEEDEQPARSKTVNHNYENGNRSGRHARRSGRRTTSPRAREGNYRYSRSSYDSSRRSYAEESLPDDDTYVSPVTPVSSSGEEESRSRSASRSSGDRRSWEEDAPHEAGDEDAWRKEDEIRKTEEAYLLKLLERNGASSDEELP